MRHIARRLGRNAGNLFLEWRYPQLRVAFGIRSHLTHKERITLYLLARSTPLVVEIGAYLGASSCCFGAARIPQGAGRVICIDTWANDAMSEGRRDTWQEFNDNTRPYSDCIVPVRGFSVDVLASVRREISHVDLLFIDGDHAYESVKADWDAYKPFLRSGSTVVFHDYGWAEGVRRVVHEDVACLVDRSDRLPNMWWGRIGRLD